MLVKDKLIKIGIDPKIADFKDVLRAINGDYVEYMDYEILEAENETLVAAIKTAICWFNNYASMDYGSHDVRKLLQEALPRKELTN